MAFDTAKQAEIAEAVRAAKSLDKPVAYERGAGLKMTADGLYDLDESTEYVYQETVSETKGVVTVQLAKAPVNHSGDGREPFDEMLPVIKEPTL